jgi:hypothetical protein
MKRRVEQDQDFEQIKQNLFDAGVSVVKAAQAQEEMFHTSVEALTEAYEANASEAPALSPEEVRSETDAIAEMLLHQRQDAIVAKNFDAYVEVENKLQLLDELAVVRLEREARQWEAQVRIREAQRQLTKPPDPESESKDPWTEKTLKAEYKTLDKFRQETKLSANKWKDAVEQMNQAFGK